MAGVIWDGDAGEDVSFVPARAKGITHADVDAFLEQVKRDRSASYWSEGPHADTLGHVEAWLLSLRDWLPDSDGA